MDPPGAYKFHTDDHRPSSPAAEPVPVARAVYMLSNKASGNSIIAIPIDPITGNLDETKQTMTSTGGKGKEMYFFGTPPPFDALEAQGAITIMGSYLFTVDAGSNLVSMWKIDDDNATQLTMIGEPQPSGGEFPSSVAVTAIQGRTNQWLVAVMNTGVQDGIGCFVAHSDTGLSKLVEEENENECIRRSLSLGQVEPINGPYRTGSQVLFTPNGDALLAIVKGHPKSDPVRPGTIHMWSISTKDSIQVGTEATINTFTELGDNLLFGSCFVPPLPGTSSSSSDPSRSTLFMTEFTTGAATVTVDATTCSAVISTFPSNTNTNNNGGEAYDEKESLAIYKIPEQKASCWAVLNELTQNTVYVTDALTGRVYEMDPYQQGAAGLIQTVDLAVMENVKITFLTDLVASHQCIYVLAPSDKDNFDRAESLDTNTATISVINISGGRGAMKFQQLVRGVGPQSCAGLAVAY